MGHASNIRATGSDLMTEGEEAFGNARGCGPKRRHPTKLSNRAGSFDPSVLRQPGYAPLKVSCIDSWASLRRLPPSARNAPM